MLIFVASAIVLAWWYVVIYKTSRTHGGANAPEEGSLKRTEPMGYNSIMRFSMSTTSTVRFDGKLAIMPQRLIGLSTQDFQTVVHAAERSNDVGSAVELADYYGYVADDPVMRIKYLQIAAKHRDVVSQYNLGFIYSFDPRVKDSTKGKYWLEVAAKSGDEMAKSLLKEMEPQ